MSDDKESDGKKSPSFVGKKSRILGLGGIFAAVTAATAIFDDFFATAATFIGAAFSVATIRTMNEKNMELGAAVKHLIHSNADKGNDYGDRSVNPLSAVKNIFGALFENSDKKVDAPKSL